MIRRKCRIPECQDEIGTMQLHHYRCGQVMANAVPAQGAVQEGVVEETLIIELRSSAEQAGNCSTTGV